MKKLKLSIFMIFIVMILAISAVSAADLEDSSDAAILSADEATIDEVATDDADVLTDGEDPTETNPPAVGNFTSLQTEIDQEGVSEVTLDKDYTRVAEDKNIEINKDITIDGQGKYTLDANKLGRFFNVNTGSTLTLKGLTLCNGITQDINDGKSNNGGAIHVAEGASLVVENVAFINNTAITNPDNNNYGQGGAIFSLGDVTIKEGSKFINNTANCGGAIYIYGDLDVTGAEFTKNKAIYPEQSVGGAIIVNGQKVTIKDSLFNENYAEYGSGAIELNVKEATISSTNFTNNKANTLQGGAIKVGQGCNLTVNENSKFINNTAADAEQGNGGAIYASFAGKLIISETEFINNTAYIGGAVYNEFSTTEITGSLFEENKATTAGAVYVLNYANIGGSTTIKESEFTSNEATGNGGAIFFYDDNGNPLTISDNTNFTDNKAGNTGGALLVAIGNAAITSTFTGNSATVNGSAVYIRADGNATIKGSTFKDNGGDAEYAIYNAGTLALENNNITDKIYSETEIIKPGSKVTIEPITNVTYGEPVVVKYSIENRSSNVTVHVFEADYEVEIDYTMTDDNVTITGLNAGQSYSIYIKNNEDENCKESIDSAFFTISQATPTLDIKPYVDEYGRIIVNVTTNNDITEENIYLKIDNEEFEYSEYIIDGFAKVDTYGVYDKGTHNVTVIYRSGNENYKSTSKNTTVEIAKETPVITIINATVNEYGAIVVNANITKVTSGNVTFKFINTDTDKNWTVPIAIGEDGFIEYAELGSFEKGYYTVIIDYEDNNEYYGAHQSTYVNVEKTAAVLDVYDVTVNEFGFIVVRANVTKGATGNVTYVFTNMNTKEQTEVNITVDEDGVADYDEPAIYDKAEYKINVWYNGDDIYYGTSDIEESVNITKEYLNVTSKVTIMDGANEATIVFTLSGNATGNATAFFLRYGTNITYAIQNGTVVIDEIFDNGAQTVLLTYEGDDTYYGFYEAYADFFVKTSSFISVKPVTVTYQNNGKFTVTLTDNDDGKGYDPIANAVITITINGKKYTGKTNAKGVATITVSGKLVPKTYSAKVVYAGTDICVGESEVVKFTVKKAKPKITAKKKTFKAKKKSKKYTITLKDNKKKAIKKVKVYIKVGKKTYKAKTNKKGKATFNLKKLKKKGTYKAKITFKGNKYFTKVTKTVKIKVKK